MLFQRHVHAHEYMLKNVFYSFIFIFIFIFIIFIFILIFIQDTHITDVFIVGSCIHISLLINNILMIHYINYIRGKML